MQLLELSLVNVLVDDTVGLFNLFDIVNILIRFKSITGDRLAFVELNVKLATNDLLLLISFVSFISLAVFLVK